MHVKLFAHTTAKVLKKKLSGKLINTSMSLEILGEQKIRSMKEKNGTVLFQVIYVSYAISTSYMVAYFLSNQEIIEFGISQMKFKLESTNIYNF